MLGYGCQALFKQQPADLGEQPHLGRKPTTTKRTSSLPPGQAEELPGLPAVRVSYSGILSSSVPALSGLGQCGWRSVVSSLPDHSFVPV